MRFFFPPPCFVSYLKKDFVEIFDSGLAKNFFTFSEIILWFRMMLHSLRQKFLSLIWIEVHTDWIYIQIIFKKKKNTAWIVWFFTFLNWWLLIAGQLAYSGDKYLAQHSICVKPLLFTLYTIVVNITEFCSQ